MHQVVHLLQLAQSNNLERSFDESTLEEFDSLCSVLSVTYVRAFDGDAFDDGFENGCFEVCTSWKANGNDGSARSNVLRELAS